MSSRHALFSRLVCIFAMIALAWLRLSPAQAEPFVIMASPTVAGPVQALSRAFEEAYPDMRVAIALTPGLAMRQTIATIENRGPYFIGAGPVHLVAPGGDELIVRLQQKYYVLPGTSVPYAAVPLVLVVPESLVEAPSSFEALAQTSDFRVAIADPMLTTLGKQTFQLLRSLGVETLLNDRLDVAADAPSVLDHLLHGKADVAIVYGPDAVQERERVRVVATAFDQLDQPIVHSMAMSRSCPDRILCEQFLSFLQTADAQKVLTGLGYHPVSAKP
jgi:molybdate transport system substrate-binding protein